MEINKRIRSELKSYFVTNAIPTEGNFAELVDGMLNQKEDGIARLPGSPLSIEAAGDETSQKKVLHLYEAFADADPAWILAMRPRVNPLDAATQKQGLGIADSTGVTRLFLDRTTGNVGVGTIEPAARLHVAGSLRVDGVLQAGSIATENGLAIPPGQPVSGVTVMDFQTLSYARSAQIQNNWIQLSNTATFSQPVLKAEAALRKVHWFCSAGGNLANATEHLMQVASVSINGNSVTVTIKGGMGPQAKWSGFNVEVLVLAILQNAV